MNQNRNRRYGWCFLVASLVVLVIIAIHVGTIVVPYDGIIREMTSLITGQPAAGLDTSQQAVFWYIRLPRLFVAMLVGAGLAVAGTVMQGVFANALADPGIIGVSAGASFGAVIAIGTGLSAAGALYMPLFAFVGACIAVCGIILLAVRGNRIETSSLLLAGVAVSMFLGALTSGVLTFLSEYRLREFLFWMIGGLEYRRWEHVQLAIGPIVIGIFVLWFLARQLNVMALGDTKAQSLGLPVMAYRLLFLLVTSLVTATAVCVSGYIGFVGLVVPHIVRLLIGYDHRYLIPYSALAGAAFLVLCDTLGRVLLAPVEIRVGIMTAIIGAPYFLYLLRRLRAGNGI